MYATRNGAKPLAAAQHADPLGRHRDELAPQPLHVRAVEAPGACKQPRRIDHVRRASLVHPHLRLRKAGRQRARRTGVIEMDVSERDHARRLGVEACQQRRDAAARARIDQHVADPPGADHLRVAEVHHVEQLRLAIAKVVRVCRPHRQHA